MAPSAIGHDAKHHPSDAEPIAALQMRLADALVVDERPVGALQIDHLELVGGGSQPAVQARDQCDIEDEIGARSAADGLDRSGVQPKGGVRALENPHGWEFYNRRAS